MKLSLLLFVSVVAFTSGATIKSTNNTKSEGGISPMLTLVATVDKKSFFVDTSVARNWTTASTYCKGLGISFALASITSASEMQALKFSSVPEFSKVSYWTAGRDKQEISQFRWDDNSVELTTAYLPFVRRTMEYLSCVEYFNAGVTSQLRNKACSHQNTGVLCEKHDYN